jgi:hypothetical protein
VRRGACLTMLPAESHWLFNKLLMSVHPLRAVNYAAHVDKC